MATPRAYFASSVLPNGLLLISGGSGNSGIFSSSELYDPATGTFSAGGSLSTGRAFQSSTVLPNGLVLIAGGLKASATSEELGE